jgi:hypothetical protein
VCPAYQPWRVVIHPSVDGDDGFDRALVVQAIEWVNVELSRDGVPRTYFELVSSSTTERGSIVVEVGYTGEDENEDTFPGIFRAAYNSNSEIVYGTITVSPEITYHAPTVYAVLRHELGHCLGLGDDPGPPVTVDLNSFMASPLVLDGDMTRRDFTTVVDAAACVGM